MAAAAIALTNGLLLEHEAKTAHGLIRGSRRFDLVAVVDPVHAGNDAGELLDGITRGIPVAPSLAAALEALPSRPQFCVVGIATHGGRLTDELRSQLAEALGARLSVVNGLHDFAGDDPDLTAIAGRTGAQIIDVRRPPPRQELHFWNGEIYKVRARRIALLGIDCAVGKRTTAKALVDACNARGLRAEMIYTGQTGWMQGWEYGFIFDTIPNDFVSGELEHAICRCDRESSPELMVLEGQSSLRNPSGPAGAEFLASAAAQGTILQHAPGRRNYIGYEDLPEAMLPAVADELELIRRYGSRPLAVTLNPSDVPPEQHEPYRAKLEQELQVPVILPLNGGLNRLREIVTEFVRGESP